MKGEKIESFEDLEVYQRLCQLHLEINDMTLKFPQFELRELLAVHSFGVLQIALRRILRKDGIIDISRSILRGLTGRWVNCRRRCTT